MSRKSERARIREIISVFIKYGVKEGLTNIINPAQLRMALEELGPTFIKIGQILSTRPDILPEAYVLEFQKLQDNVKPENFGDIRRIVESELHQSIDDVFTYFNEDPVASASLAQAHIAELKNGNRVVVKVQRPNARSTMLSDVAILKRLTLVMRLAPQGHVLNPSEVVDELMHAVRNELDFLIESNNIKRFYENNKNVRFIACPKVYSEYTTSNIIVMEYISGIKITDTNRLEAEGYELKDMAYKLANNYLKQIFEDGFFHADPHPGNIIIRDNKIAYIDFGIIGTLSKSSMSKLYSLLYGLSTRSLDRIAQAILRIGVKKGSIDSSRLYYDIEHIYNRYIDEPLYQINLTQLMDEIFRACRKNSIAMPREFLLLIRGMMTVEGVVIKLDPDINVMDVVVPYIRRQMLKKIDYRQDITEQLENFYGFAKVGWKIPVRFYELMNSALAGKLRVQMEHTNLEKSISELSRMANRIVFGIIVASLVIGSSLVIRADVGPKFYDMSIIGFVGYTGTVVLGMWLLISILRSGKI